MWQTTLAGNERQNLRIVWTRETRSARRGMAQAFDMKVIAWSQNLTTDAAQHGVECVEFDALFERSDIISVQTVLSDCTRDKVGARELGLMKPSAYIAPRRVVQSLTKKRWLRRLRANNRRCGPRCVDVEPLPADHPPDVEQRGAHGSHRRGRQLVSARLRASGREYSRWQSGTPTRLLNAE